jgi:hypothetical protein
MRQVAAIVMTASLLLLPTAAFAAEETPVGSADSEVRVVERGEQPWRLLRYDWTVGSTESARTDYSMSMSMVQDGEEIRMTLPASMEFETTVTDVDEDGTARLEIVYTGFDIGLTEMTIDGESLDDAMLEAMAAEFDGWSRQVVGSSGWEVYDSRGVLLDWGIDTPEAFPEDLRSQVEQMSAYPTVLPQEPVGVGAIWEGAGSFSESGFELGVTELNELLALDGDTLELDTRIELDASGAIPPSELGIDEEGTVDDLTVRGGGPVKVDLGRVFAETVWEVEFHMEMSTPDGAGGTSAMTMDIEMDLEIAPS